MKRFARMFAVVVLGAALSAVAAHASESMVHFGVGGGLSMPVGDLKDANYNAGFNGHVIVGVMPAGKNYGLCFTGAYNQLGGDDIGTSTVDRKVKVIGGSVDAVFMPPMEGKVKVYLGAGVDVDNIKSSQTTNNIATDYSSTQLGFNGMAGFNMKAGGKMSWGLGAAYHTASKDGSTSAWIPISLNIMFN